MQFSTDPDPRPSHTETLRQDAPDPTRQQQIEHLRELIAALDGRVPHLERTGELHIARDAAALRHKALERIAELERSGDP